MRLITPMMCVLRLGGGIAGADAGHVPDRHDARQDRAERVRVPALTRDALTFGADGRWEWDTRLLISCRVSHSATPLARLSSTRCASSVMSACAGSRLRSGIAERVDLNAAMACSLASRY
jgi:hypothetical protein